MGCAPSYRVEWFEEAEQNEVVQVLEALLYIPFAQVQRRVELMNKYRVAQRLQLYSDPVGSRGTRWERSSHVLVQWQGRLRPAQCLRFLAVDGRFGVVGDVPGPQVWTLVQLQWYDRYGAEEDLKDFKPDPLLGDTVSRWFLQSNESKFGGRPKLPRYVPIQRIHSRFVVAPCSQDDKPLLKKLPKVKPGHAEPPKPKKLFKTCPLPLQLPL